MPGVDGRGVDRPGGQQGLGSRYAVLDQQERHAGCPEGEHGGPSRQFRQEMTRAGCPVRVDDGRVEP